MFVYHPCMWQILAHFILHIKQNSHFYGVSLDTNQSLLQAQGACEESLHGWEITIHFPNVYTYKCKYRHPSQSTRAFRTHCTQMNLPLASLSLSTGRQPTWREAWYTFTFLLPVLGIPWSIHNHTQSQIELAFDWYSQFTYVMIV